MNSCDLHLGHADSTRNPPAAAEQWLSPRISLQPAGFWSPTRALRLIREIAGHVLWPAVSRWFILPDLFIARLPVPTPPLPCALLELDVRGMESCEQFSVNPGGKRPAANPLAAPDARQIPAFWLSAPLFSKSKVEIRAGRQQGHPDCRVSCWGRNKTTRFMDRSRF